MPWKEWMAVKERMKFLLEWEARWNAGEGRMNFAELCREYGVSRETGYGWLRRFRAAKHDPAVASERSRRPHTTPTKVQEAVEELVVEPRKAHPSWGPKKLCAWLRNNYSQLEVPAPSTVGESLNRRGLTVSRLRRRHGTRHARAPFADVTGPNATWCVDFKGHFAHATVCVATRSRSSTRTPASSALSVR